MAFVAPEKDRIPSGFVPPAKDRVSGGWTPPASDRIDTPPEQKEIGLGRQLAGITAEIAAGTAGQLTAAAAGLGTGGAGYFGVTFGFGYSGSLLAQKGEDPDRDISQGRAIMSGVLNMIPGAPIAKGVLKGGKVLATEGAKQLIEGVTKREGRKAIARRAAAGVGMATAYEGGSKTIDVALGAEGAELPSVTSLATSGVFGGAFGGGLEVAQQKMAPVVRNAFTRLWPRLKGKSEAEAGKVLDRLAAEGNEDALTLFRAAQEQAESLRLQKQQELEQVFTPFLNRLDAQEMAAKTAARAQRASERNVRLAAEAQEQSVQPIRQAREAALQEVLPPPTTVDPASKLDMDSPVARLKALVATGRPFQALQELPLEDQLLINRAYRPSSEATRRVEAKLLQQKLVQQQLTPPAPRVPLEDVPSPSAVLDKLGWEPRMRQRVADDLAMGFTARGTGIDLSNGLLGSVLGYVLAPEDSRGEGAVGGFVAGLGARKAVGSLTATQAYTKAADALKKLIPNVVPSKYVGAAVADAVNLAKGKVAALNEQSSKIRDSVAKWASRQDDVDAAVRMIEKYNKGQILPSDLPPEIRYQMQYLLETRTELQNQLLINVQSLSDETKGIIQRSIGQYLTREYRIHSDKTYKPSKEAADALMAKLRLSKDKGGVGLSQEDANVFLQDLRNPDTFNAMSLGRGGSHKGILLHRKDLSKEVRDYLGEIHDPLEQIYGTITKLTRLNAEAAKEQSIMLHGLKAGWVKRGADPELVPFPSRYGFGGGEKFSIQPEALRALQQLEGKVLSLDNASMGYKALVGMNNAMVAASKFAAVPLNPASYAVQVWGNSTMMLATPGVSWNAAKQGLKFAWQNTGVPFEMVGGRAKPSFLAISKEMNMLKQYDLLDQNVTVSDIRRGFTWLENAMGDVAAPFKAAGGVVSKAYQLPDNAARLIVFYSNRENLKKLGTGLVGEALDKEAARITNLTFPNYSRINDSIKALSKFGLLNQFVAFNAELLRTSINSMTLGSGMVRRGLATGNRAMVTQGLQRTMVPIAMSAAAVAGVETYNSLHDVPKARADAIKEALVPEYNERDMLMLEMVNDGKSYRYSQPSYLVPYAIMGDIASAFDDSGGGYEGLLGALRQTWNAVGGDGAIVHRALFSTLMNSKPEGGGKISPEGNPLELGAYFLEKGFPVGFVREYNLLRDALSGTTRVGGRELTVGQLGERLAGLRVYQYNIEQAAAQKAKPIAQVFNDARGEYRRDVERNASPNDIAKSYERNAARYERTYEALRTRIDNLRLVGLDTNEIVKVLGEAGVGRQEILMGLEGVFVPMSRDIPTPAREVYESSIAGLPVRDATSAIYQLSKSDPMLARQLRDLYRADARSQYRGLSPEETILGSLSASTGQRARYLAEKTRGMTRESREAYLKDLGKRGLVNQQVMQDIIKELYTQP